MKNRDIQAFSQKYGDENDKFSKKLKDPLNNFTSSGNYYY
jgi:hypothetical protein